MHCYYENTIVKNISVVLITFYIILHALYIHLVCYWTCI